MQRQQNVYTAGYLPAKYTGYSAGSGFSCGSDTGRSRTGGGIGGSRTAYPAYRNTRAAAPQPPAYRDARAAAPQPPAYRNTRAAAPQPRNIKVHTRQHSGAASPRRRKKRRRSLRLLIFTAACLCLTAFGVAATRPTLPIAVSSIVYPLDLGGAWDADTETALRALSRQRPEIQPMLDDPAAWPADVAALLARNEEALEFVLAYPSLAGTVPPDTVEEAQQGTFPALLQWDARWGASPYAGSVLALSGCGPTVLSVVTCGLTGNTAWTPAAIAEWAQGWGYATESGTSWELMRSGCEHFGVRAEELSLSEAAVFRALEAGSPVICSVRPGDFTTAGHFIVLTGTENGLIRLVDPNSPARSAALWEWERLMPQIKNLWAYTAV